MTKRDLVFNTLIGCVIGCIIGVVAINNLTTNTTTAKREIEPLVEEHKVVEVAECPYNMEDLETLAHLINGEAGANYCSEQMRYYVGSVALNRVKSNLFPDTLQEVVSQKGQYQCYVDGNYNKEPNEACYEIAEDLLVNGSLLPSNVLYQAEFRQGRGIYCRVQNMYFCYQ